MFFDWPLAFWYHSVGGLASGYRPLPSPRQPTTVPAGVEVGLDAAPPTGGSGWAGTAPLAKVNMPPMTIAATTTSTLRMPLNITCYLSNRNFPGGFSPTTVAS